MSKGHLNDGPQGRILLRKLDGQFNGLMWPAGEPCEVAAPTSGKKAVDRRMPGTE
ncbi:MAG: hypothetical protein PHE53_13020 [Thermoguttaceae bacterium]|nr:hypothetical protein [Thermoguttaceae bacterium]